MPSVLATALFLLAAACSCTSDTAAEFDPADRPIWRMIDARPVVSAEELAELDATVKSSRAPCDAGSGGADYVVYSISGPVGSADSLVSYVAASAEEAGWTVSEDTIPDVTILTAPVPGDDDSPVASMGIKRLGSAQVSVNITHRGDGC